MSVDPGAETWIGVVMWLVTVALVCALARR